MLRIYTTALYNIEFAFEHFYKEEGVDSQKIKTKYFQHENGRCFFIHLPTLYRGAMERQIRRLFDQYHFSPHPLLIPNPSFFEDLEDGKLDYLPDVALKGKTFRVYSTDKDAVKIDYALDLVHRFTRHFRIPRDELFQMVLHNKADHSVNRYCQEVQSLKQFLLLMTSTSTHQRCSTLFDIVFTSNFFVRFSNNFHLTTPLLPQLGRAQIQGMTGSLARSLQYMFEPSVMGERRGDTLEDNLKHFFDFSSKHMEHGFAMYQNSIKEIAIQNAQLSKILRVN